MLMEKQHPRSNARLASDALPVTPAFDLGLSNSAKAFYPLPPALEIPHQVNRLGRRRCIAWHN